MHSVPMGQPPELITARQVQLMLGIDRSTVYRMAEDGRLPAVKVGRQWRFAAGRVRALLAGDQQPQQQSQHQRHREVAAGPDPVVAAAVAQTAAELLGVMIVVTDMDARPLTPVANPCPWFTARSGDPSLLDACTAEWQQLADDPDFGPRFALGVLGFECARAFIRHGTSLVGMVLAGGVAPDGPAEPGLYVLDGAGRQRVLAGLPKVAAVLSQITPRGIQQGSPS